MIGMKSVAKRFGNTKVLTDVTFKLEKGDCYGLLGKNGAGKTTLLNIIIGSTDASFGTFSLNGSDSELKDLSSLKHKIGFFIDDQQLVQDFTAWEFLTFVANIYKVPTGEIKNRAVSLFTYFFDELPDINIRINSMSRGMKVKVGICAALMHKPQLLILDEPFAGLDPTSADKLITLLTQFRSESTILISSHDLDYIERVCNKIGVLDEGHMQYDGTLHDFTMNGQKIIGESLASFVKSKDYDMDQLNWLL